MESMTEIIHNRIKEYHYNTGIDFTMGNGYDTVFLSTVCDEVYAFDIQKEAIESTKEKINNEHVHLILDSHDQFDQYIDTFNIGIFNLGYLPGANHNIVTQSEVTLKALSKGLEALEHKGRIFIAVYIGHDHGKEGQAIEAYCELLDKRYNVMKYSMLNKRNAPYVIEIEKK